MSQKNTTRQTWLGGGIGVLFAVTVGFGLLDTTLNLGKKLIDLSYDLPFHFRPITKPNEVVMIYMDDDSHRELQQPYDGPWDRGVHAQLLERLTADRAKAVVFDVLFSGTNLNHPDGDKRFARAIKENGKVVLGAEYAFTADGSPTLHRAIDPFYDAAASAQGFVQLLPDQDFIVRRHLHVPLEKDADSYSSFTWEAAALLGAAATSDPKNRFTERWLNYYGPPGTLRRVSFHRAITTNIYYPAGAFSNKVVFVGSSLKTKFSGERKDEYRTPYTKGGQFGPAIDAHATQFLNLVRGDWLNRFSAPAELAVIALAGLLFGYGLSLLRPLAAGSVAIFGAIVITVIAHLLFWKFRLWFPWMIIVAAQIPVALLWSVIFNSVQLYVQNKLFEQTLSFYLSPKLVKKFANDKELLKPGAKKETLTILFSDIAGFTSISEGMDSDELALHMNKYFETAVTQCIHHTDGTIVKYIGDAIFSFWNAPDLQADHQLRACVAALRFRDQPPQYMNNQQLITRIGLHTGVANVGNFGSTVRVDYTALGESINLASRMEGLNKYLGTDVLITGETQAGIDGRLVTRSLGKFRLKGFERSVDVYQLVDSPDKSEASRPMRESFAEALKLFQNGNFAGAETAFRSVLVLAPKDGPTLFFLSQIEHFREEPPPSQWNGEVELKEK